MLHIWGGVGSIVGFSCRLQPISESVTVKIFWYTSGVSLSEPHPVRSASTKKVTREALQCMQPTTHTEKTLTPFCIYLHSVTCIELYIHSLMQLILACYFYFLPAANPACRQEWVAQCVQSQSESMTLPGIMSQWHSQLYCMLWCTLYTPSSHAHWSNSEGWHMQCWCYACFVLT